MKKILVSVTLALLSALSMAGTSVDSTKTGISTGGGALGDITPTSVSTGTVTATLLSAPTLLMPSSTNGLTIGSYYTTFKNDGGALYAWIGRGGGVGGVLAPNAQAIGFAQENTESDAYFTRDAAGRIAIRNGTNAQGLSAYNTYTDGSNYERGGMRWNSNVFEINTEAAGTGLASRLMRLSTAGGSINFAPGGTDLYRMNTSGFFPLGSYDLGTAGLGWKRFYLDYTNTATVGAVTINKPTGRVNVAAAGSSIVVTNSLVTAAAKVFTSICSNDSTAYIKNTVPAAGSFTITLGAAATAQTCIDFFVVNAD